MEKDSSGQVANLTWMIANPSTDRSYRVRWNWNYLTSNNAAKP